MSFESLLDRYIHGIILQSRGLVFNPFEMYQFMESREKIRHRLNTLEGYITGLNGFVINVLMQTGDKFLANARVKTALELYREAVRLFPGTAICLIREAQCLVELNCFDDAKKSCRKAIRHCDQRDFDELLSLIEIFEDYGAFLEAHDLYISFSNVFPHRRYYILQKMEQLKLRIGIKTEADKKVNENKNNKDVAKSSSRKSKTVNKNVSQATNKIKVDEVSGEAGPSAKAEISNNTATVKAKKTAKQLKREHVAKKNEIDIAIEKAKKEQEEKLKQQKEVEIRKRKEREEREEKIRKQEEVEARKRKEQEEREEKLKQQKEVEARKRKELEERKARERKDEDKKRGKIEKQKNEQINKHKKQERLQKQDKQSLKKSDVNEDTRTIQSEKILTNPALSKKDKVDINDMPNNVDRVLSSGSLFRRVCPSCNTPQVISTQICPSCKRELVIWYKKVGTSRWVNQRKPPSDVLGRYVQCKHFLLGKRCVKYPCTFAHGQDELEIWELSRRKVTYQQVSQQKPKTSVSSLQKSTSCTTLNSHDFGGGRRSRTESLSSLRSVHSSSNPFEVLSSDDMQQLDNFESDSECSFFLSQDVYSQGSASVSSSTFSLNIDMNTSHTNEASPQNSVTPGEPEVNKNDEEWTEVRSKKAQKALSEKKSPEELNGKTKKRKKKSRSRSSKKTSSHVLDTISSVMEEAKLRCNFCDIKFSSQSQLEYHYSDPQHKVNVMKRTRQLNAKSGTNFRPPPDGVRMGRYKLCERFQKGKGRCFLGDKCTFAHGNEEYAHWISLYRSQVQQLEQLQKERLLTESFSEKIRRRIKCEGEHHVLQDELPGVTVNCSPLQVQLDGPQDHTWIFYVQIQRKCQLPLSQVAFLLETHLDKFKFLRNTSQNHTSNLQSIRFLDEDFVEDSVKHESAVQFGVQFCSSVFGDFEQKLVFDFGHGSVLFRSLFVSVMSKEICHSKEDESLRRTVCRISEWSVEDMELVLCRDRLELDPVGLSEQYSIPSNVPVPSKLMKLTRESYCEIWHQILFIEEQYIRKEVGRYDRLNSVMKIINCFNNADKTFFAQPGEYFGEIYLSDYLVMDEVAGHLINRSVLSVILRFKLENSQSTKAYECSIKLKTPETVIVKLNEELCKEYVLEIEQVFYIDLKFRFNRLPMCEMHQAIDMCRQKTQVLIPDIKKVSYKDKKSIHDWHMDRKPNPNQHEAIAMILDPNPTPPILLIGPFGAGKTFTLSLACVSIICPPEGKFNKVLICTHSNSAADIHVEHLDAKLKKKPSLNIRPLRVLALLRNINTVPQGIRKYCNIQEATNLIKEPTENEIRDHNVIVTTLATARMLWKFYHGGTLRFTHILIDEAAQALEPQCLASLVMADDNTKIVLAGDHKQMGPPVYSKCLWSEDFGPKISLLERLFNNYKQYSDSTSQPSSSSDYNSEHNSNFLQTSYVVLLTENYRCHAEILNFPSDCLYGGELIARGDQSTHNSIPVLSFYVAQGMDNRDEGCLTYYNEAEVAEVVKRVEELILLWPKDWSKSIGVLTPYRDQVKRIREGLRKKRLDYVDVETVENVQGKEFKALFISTVRTMWTCSQIQGRNSDPSELDFGFLSNPRFLNTAVTRAQSLLAVVGDPMSLCSVGSCRELWKDYLRRCEDNKGLYGCTLKAVMDFCLRSQMLDPGANEFTPRTNVGNHEPSMSQSVTDAPVVSSKENSTSNGSESSVSRSGINTQNHVDTTQENREDDLPDDHNGKSSDQDESKEKDNSETIQSATENFFRRDDVENVDKIIEELMKACQETKRMDEENQNITTIEDFPPLNNVSSTSSTPHWPNISINRTFSAGFKDGRIELGFHIKDSERLFRLTGGKLSFKEGDNHQPTHDIEAFPPEELLKLLRDNPNLFMKCSFRVDNSGRQPKYCGQLPTPDSPDIHIPGRVRGVYEDDVIVLEIQPSALVKDRELQEQVLMLGYIRGILRRLIEPKERQFVCTVDRANVGVMIPINKNSPKLMNFTKTDENIIPIYSLKNGEVTRATIVSKKHYGEALAGERLFIVKYLKWRSDCPYPLGLAVRHIPHGKDFKTGMEILYEEYNVRRRFDRKLRESVSSKFDDWQIPVSEEGRVVYQDNVFTVDPPDSKDLDDAISVQSLGNGNYDLHIHIADVSYFVQPNTPLDEEARLRGTSYYPPKPDETVPMLPRELSENCCSLLEGQDRLAVTVSVEVKLDGTVVGETRIERSVVHSSCRLTYHEAQKIIDEASEEQVLNNQEEKEIPVGVSEAIGVVHRIAQGHRINRLGLERSLYERTDDDDDDSSTDRESHQMIAELMIMANHLVAKYLLTKFPRCTPLRVQPPPKIQRLVKWRHRFQKLLNVSLGLEWLGDPDVVQEGTIELKVPFRTWNIIMKQVEKNCSFQELVKLVCDLDLFPQLALANTEQQRMQQKGRYISSGETFENIPFPWHQNEMEPPKDEENVRAIVPSNALANSDSLPEGNNVFPSNRGESASNSGCVETEDETASPENSSEIPPDDMSLPEDGANDEMPGHSDDVGVQNSTTVSNSQDLNTILYGHSSLRLDAYCHFTSPIRRYIDIIVHRLLVASIENTTTDMNCEDITTFCDRSTFIARNSGRFERDGKKLKLALDLHGSFRFVSAFIEEAAPDALKLFFGTGKYELLSGKSVRIARLCPEKDPEVIDDQIQLQWTLRLLRLDKEGRTQPRLPVSDDEESKDLAQKLERQTEDKDALDLSEDDFDYTVSGEDWRGVLESVKNQDKDQLSTRLQKLDDEVKKQRKPEQSTHVSLVKRLNDNPDLSSRAPYQRPNAGRKEQSETETDLFLKVTKFFKPFDRVKVQICSQISRGVLSPSIQLFKLTDKIHACIEHRSNPTTCFAKTSYKRPTNTKISDITDYVKLWKPVLMMEIATSAVRDDDVITLSNLRVNLECVSKGLVTIEFELLKSYIKDHFLDPLDLNLMCVRVKDPDGTGKDTGYWVGHFQISEELWRKEDARKAREKVEKNTSTKKEEDVPTNDTWSLVDQLPTSTQTKAKTSTELKQEDWPSLGELNPAPRLNVKKISEEDDRKSSGEKGPYRPLLARLIHSSTPVPQSLLTQKICYVTAELINLSIPERRRLGALVNSVVASELVQDICTGMVSADLDDDVKLPRELSLCTVYHNLQIFHPLNRYQRDAVEEALTKSFTLIQGPPGTGKTVTGVHIAYWFAQLNKARNFTIEEDGNECNGSMVFYCGPSNKSVDVVARYLMKISDLKILRVYGQEVERKEFPIPDKITMFRSKRVPVQLNADEDLKDVSLHHVIRSRQCPFADKLMMFDQEFQEYTENNMSAPRDVIDDFNKVKSAAEKWAITQRGVNVILATCTTAYSPRILSPREGFICQCIIDECGMCIEAETLCAMLGSNAKQVVLIGDHKQLQPIIQCEKARELGLGISMFERFSERAKMLKIQYRMHEELCQFPSQFFYGGELKTADQVRNRRPHNVTWPNGDRYPFVFHHVEGIEESLIVSTDKGNESSKKNQEEVNKVVYIARRLTNEGIKGEDIVVLSPYRAQCFEITEKLKQHGLNGISVSSVVAAQGSERNYVILSLVRSLPEREIERNPSRSWLMEKLGFITDEHQINVALTRAKCGLCIIGNANLIGVCSMWRALLEHYKAKGCLLKDVP